MERIFLGLGSNVGNRLLNLMEALRGLAACGGIFVIHPSQCHIIETKAVNAVGDTREFPNYLNTSVEIRTTLAPKALLDTLLGVERSMGRIRSTRWEPRVIDIDLLLYGQQQIRTRHLAVPHPELHRRQFVLCPLAAIAPEVVVPGRGATVAQLAHMLMHPSVRSPYPRKVSSP